MEQPFRYYMQVRYGECDAQKVVFNARYGDYIDLAATEFLHHICDQGQLPGGGFDYQVVKLTIEWKAPARYRDQLEITVRASHLGNTSFTLAMNIHNAVTGQFLASGEMIGVTVHPETMEKMPIPGIMRHALERGGQGDFIDHAGIHTVRDTAEA
ncbi:acyl-CoA thioester hydrolase [Marinobacter daqiaonensis]|uniref:Acyl-CoA thioester hydrolase n=1 Tax=Marinobacter daqiaonensis TaxID=650891 RepID=A0A1I6H0I0_9GAMM|nr:thioesterase family protein [Marinobacter daqiaonensis]SFR47958.1 acyl-CoA thioester hydrolase [Marinobacter daqiaonensis]